MKFKTLLSSLVLVLVFSGLLTAQPFNKSKGFELRGGLSQIEVFPNGDHLLVHFDGYNFQFDLYSASGDSLKSNSFFYNGYSYDYALEVLGANRFLLSFFAVDGCDLITLEESYQVLFSRDLQALDTLIQTYPQEEPMRETEPYQWRDSLIVVSASNGFRIIDYKGDSLVSRYDTVDFSFYDLQSIPLQGDSLLLSDPTSSSSTQVFRLGDSAFLPQTLSLPEPAFDYDSQHLAYFDYSANGTIQLIRRSDLSLATRLNNPWIKVPTGALRSQGKILLYLDHHYAVYEPTTASLGDTGSFYTHFGLPNPFQDIEFRDSIIVASGSQSYTDYHLESRRLGRGAAPIFHGLAFRLEHFVSNQFDAIYFNQSSDTIYKLGIGFRSHGSRAFCQSIMTRRVHDQLSLAPGDSLRIAYGGSPFYVSNNGLVAADPFVVYMVNDNILDKNERFTSDIRLHLAETSLQQLEVFPNPMRESLNIRWKQGEVQALQCHLRGSNGSLLISVVWNPATKSELHLSTESLSPGLYFIEVESDRGNFYYPIIKSQ